MDGKTCRRCGVFRSIDRFNKHPNMRDGFANICKDCKNAAKRAKSSYSVRFFTPEEDAVLRAEYPFKSGYEIAAKLGRTYASIVHRAGILGIKKDAEYLNIVQQQSVEKLKGTQFPKGHVPWTKGKKVGTRGRAGETQFKAGHTPHNWQPVGTVRRDAEGYLWKKISDQRSPARRDWKEIHRLVWEEHNGPIPEGHMVVFINGNKEDIRIENLMVVSREENARRNMAAIPPEVRKVTQLIGCITRQINRKQRAEQHG